MKELLLISQLVGMAVQEAPQIEAAVQKGAELAQALFTKGVITADEQAAYMKWGNDHMAATLAGNEPPEFVVE